MKPALVLVDLQVDYLKSAGLQPSADALASHAAQLLNEWRRRQLPVIHVFTTVSRNNDQRLPHWRMENRWQCEAGTPGHEPPPSLKPFAGEKVVHKSGFNGFANGELDGALRDLRCDTVVLAGLHLHTCVRAVAVEGLERNFRVCIAEDAVASNEPILSAATRRWLAQRGVRFETSAALLAEVEGKAKGDFVHRSPVNTGEVLFSIANVSPEEISNVVTKARAVFPKWRGTSRDERLQILEKVAAALEKVAPVLGRQMATEIGKPVRHAAEEIRRTADNFRDVTRRAQAEPGVKKEAAGQVRYEPLGVVALISAWNNPSAIPMGKIAPALAYGNVVVWKPAPVTKRISEALAKLFFDAGLPQDVLQILHGDHNVAQQLAECAEVDAVTLTGSSIGGYALGEICARRVIPFQAELSGNNAAIIWEDADDKWAEQVVWGAFAFAGQRCTANRRVIIPTEKREEFLSLLEAAAVRLTLGDPLQEATEIGPVVSAGKRDELVELVQRAQASGAATKVILPHSELASENWFKRGAYVLPVIVCCEQPEHPLVQEETMSPLLVVQTAQDFEHAIELCNGVRHGLAAALFTKSLERQRQFLDQAQAGILKLNSTTAGVDVTLPFGGWKASGVGPPEHGEADRLFYTRMQAVYGFPDA